MVVYRLLGQSAVNAFARSFGVSYALDQVTQWQDIANEAVKAVVVMFILERLFISSPLVWIEGARGKTAAAGGSSILSSLPHFPSPHRPHRLPFGSGSDDAQESELGGAHPSAPEILPTDVDRMTRRRRGANVGRPDTHLVRVHNCVQYSHKCR